MARAFLSALALAAVALAFTGAPFATVAQAPPGGGGMQPGGAAPAPPKEQGGAGQGGSGQDGGLGKIQPVPLTRNDVERLVKLLPQVARLGAEHNKRLQQSGNAEPAKPTPEMQQIDRVLTQNGLTMRQFATQMATLVSTYFALSPEAVDRQLPSMNDPEVRRFLADPSVPTEKKTEVKQQISAAQQNKEAIRKQLTQLATEDNKRVVKPLLPQVKSALEDAQSEARKEELSAPAPAPQGSQPQGSQPQGSQP